MKAWQAVQLVVGIAGERSAEVHWRAGYFVFHSTSFIRQEYPSCSARQRSPICELKLMACSYVLI